MELDLKVLAGLLDVTVGRERRVRGCEYLKKSLEAPFVVFARVVAGEVSGRNVGDCFGVDAYNLGNISLCGV